MIAPTRERLTYQAAMVVSVGAAVGALVVGDEVEVTLLMVTAVIAGLVCFDVSMERRVQAFAPWALLSIAPVLKTVPAVWLQLQGEDSGALPERYDHAGSLLFGLCVLGAVVVLSRPAPGRGASVAGFDAAVIVGSAAVAGLAGASVAFLADSGFGSATAGRVLETPTWIAIGGLVAASALAAGHARVVSNALAGVLLVAGVTAGMLAYTVAGQELDLGVWAMLFAALTISAGATGADLGQRATRVRTSNVAVIAAIIAGLVGSAAAISARSDRTSWGPGWALLGVVSLAMFALAMATRPPERRLAARGRSGPQEIGINDAERSARAHARAMRSLPAEPAASGRLPDGTPAAQAGGVRATGQDRAGQLVVAAVSPEPPGRLVPRVAEPPVVQPVPPAAVKSPGVAPAVPPVAVEAPVAQSPVAQRPVPESAAPEPAVPESAAPEPAVLEPPASLDTPVANPVEAPVASQAEPADPTALAVAHAAPPAASPAASPVGTQSSVVLSDASLVSTVQAAVAVRTAPAQQRHTLAPLSQAHHFDPSTGLLSASGLEHAIARAFDLPRQAGHVTIMMLVIRDLDDIERRHGRLASAAVTRQVAERVRSLLPDGTGARFGRSAYAVVFLGDLGNSSETIQHLARVLLQLRAPVEGGSLGDKIDVVAGMAQCYAGEDAAQFVTRANQGLARAVHCPEPTFVAMP